MSDPSLLRCLLQWPSLLAEPSQRPAACERADRQMQRRLHRRWLRLLRL